MKFRAAMRALFEKDSAVDGLVYGPRADMPIWSNNNPIKLSEEGYKKNVIAFRCIEEVARSAASVPLKLYRHKGDGDKEEEFNHPLNLLLKRPNPQESLARLIHSLVGYYNITGNTYFEAVAPRETAPPREIYVKRPDRMSIIAGSKSITGYRYSTTNGSVHWPVNDLTGQSQILHLKTFNPFDDFLGLSPISIAASNIDQHNEIDIWNYSMLKNGVFSGSVIKTDKTLGDKEYFRIMNQLKEKQTGSINANKNLILEKGLSFEGMSFNPKDMAIIENKGTTARFICQAFGVPPFLLGLPEGATFSNVAEARLYFWDNTIIPLLGMILAELNNWLVPMFDDPSLMIMPDYDECPALEPRRQQRWDRISKADFLTINEKRQSLGFKDDPNGDEILVSATMIPLGADLAEPAKDASKAMTDLDLSKEDYNLWLIDQGVGEIRARALTELAYEKTGTE